VKWQSNGLYVSLVIYDNKQWVVAVGGNVFSQCIPYNEETKYLLGTADDCPDKYKTW
jgi:hypothetical protein